MCTMKYFILLFGLILGLPLMAQQEFRISGQVKDVDSKENLPFCKVVALDAADSVIRGGITDDNGFFRLPLPPGQYKLVISFYGYMNDTVPSLAVGEDNFIGVFKLTPEVRNLDEMSVEASSRIDLLDRDVQVITEEQKVGATAAKDVLDKLPGISYDDYTGTLSVDNDANIMILVNGVEKSQEYIQNLDPERLLRVETTRDPGGRYGLEGYSAIVNVILRDDYKGTELYLEEMQLVDIAPDRLNKLDFLIGSLGLTFNYTKNKLNLYASGGAYRRNFKIMSRARTEYADGYQVFENPISDNPNTLVLQYGAYYTLGFDYRINPKHSISFETNISGIPIGTSEEGQETQTRVYANDSLLANYAFYTKSKSETFDSRGSFFYIGEFNKRNRLNANFTYSYYADEYHLATLQEGSYDRDETGTNKKHYTRLYVEFDHDFSPKIGWQIGYGNTWRELNNDFTVDQLDLVSSQQLNYTSDFFLSDMRHKLYTNFSWKFSDKWSMRAGIASENSAPRTQGQQLHYIIYQPLFDIRFAAGQKLNLTLKYRTTSEYPDLSQINPFTSKVNPRITSTGNPFLRPTTVHQFSLRINAFQGVLSLEPYVNYSNNAIVQVGELGADSIFNFRFENAELYQRNGVTLNFSKYFMKPSLLVQGNFDFYQSRILSTSKDNVIADWRSDIDLIYIFRKSQTLLGLKYQHQLSKSINGLGYDRGDVDFWMLFYKQPLFKKRASVMFGYFLPISLGADFNQNTRIETTGFTMQNDNNVSIVKNMFILEFSYRFAKGKSVRKTDKDLEIEEEKSGGGIF